MKSLFVSIALIIFISMPFVGEAERVSPSRQTSMQTSGKLKNRLPRKAILNAAQQALQDSTSISDDFITIDKNTTLISIEVFDRINPYTITVDSLGITLELFCNDKCVYNDFIEYKKSNFNKIKAKANASKLRITSEHKDSINIDKNITIKLSNNKETYCTLTNNFGNVNHDGDFYGFVKYIESLIPDFSIIINSDYKNTEEFIDDIAIINNIKVSPSKIKETGNILVINIDEIIAILDTDSDKNVVFEALMPYGETQNLKLMKINHYNNKKNKLDLYGFTYENIVKEGVFPKLTKTTNNGIITAEFSIEHLTKGIYCIYNPDNSYVYLFEITESNVVG